MKGWLLVALSLAATGCARSLPPPPRAPTLTTPADALPPDLDLVVRVDLAKVRAALGPEGVELMRRGTGSAAADPGAALVASALARSTTAYLALRPELIPGEADNVLIVEGHFAELDLEPTLTKTGWSSAVDLGGDVRRFDRKSSVGRAAPARIYAFGNERLVFVSPAEIDSVQAVIEGRLAPSALRPREQGVVAFAARMRALRYGIGLRYPTLARSLGAAAGFEGTLDAAPTGLALEVAFELPNEVAAEQSADALGKVRDALEASEGKLATVARGARAEAVGRYVVVRLALERGLL